MDFDSINGQISISQETNFLSRQIKSFYRLLDKYNDNSFQIRRLPIPQDVNKVKFQIDEENYSSEVVNITIINSKNLKTDSKATNVFNNKLLYLSFNKFKYSLKIELHPYCKIDTDPSFRNCLFPLRVSQFDQDEEFFSDSIFIEFDEDQFLNDENFKNEFKVDALRDYYQYKLSELSDQKSTIFIEVDLNLFRRNFNSLLELSGEELILPIIGKFQKIHTILIEKISESGIKKQPFLNVSLRELDDDVKVKLNNSFINGKLIAQPEYIVLEFQDQKDDKNLLVSLLRHETSKKIFIKENIEGEKIRLKRILNSLDEILKGNVANDKIVQIFFSNNIDYFNTTNEFNISNTKIDYLNNKYPVLRNNFDQLRTLEKILNKDYYQNNNVLPSINIVQGPPGTGKTELILQLIKELNEKKLNVLVTSNVHVAIDNVSERLINEKEIIVKRFKRISDQESYEDELFENQKNYIKNQVLLGFKFEKKYLTKVTDFDSFEKSYLIDKENLFLRDKGLKAIREKNPEYFELESKIKEKKSNIEKLRVLLGKLKTDLKTIQITRDNIATQTMNNSKNLSGLKNKEAEINKSIFDINETIKSLNIKNELIQSINKTKVIENSHLIKWIRNNNELQEIKKKIEALNDEILILRSINNQKKLIETIGNNLYLKKIYYKHFSDYLYEFAQFTMLKNETNKMNWDKPRSKKLSSKFIQFAKNNYELLISRNNPRYKKFLLKLKQIIDFYSLNYFKRIAILLFDRKFNGFNKKSIIISKTYIIDYLNNFHTSFEDELQDQFSYYINNESIKIRINNCQKLIEEENIKYSNFEFKLSILKFISMINLKINHLSKLETFINSNRISILINDINVIKDQKLVPLQAQIKKDSDNLLLFEIQQNAILLKEANLVSQIKQIEQLIQNDHLQWDLLTLKLRDNKINNTIWLSEYNRLSKNFDYEINQLTMLIFRKEEFLRGFKKRVLMLNSISDLHKRTQFEKLISNYILELIEITDNNEEENSNLGSRISGNSNSFRNLFRVSNSPNVLLMTTNQVAQIYKINPELIFDYVIVDEASKCSLEDLLIPLTKAKRLILIGDFMQLDKNYDKGNPENVLSDQNWKLLNEPPFTNLIKKFLLNGESLDKNPYVGVLKNQFRMSKGIFKLIQPIYALYEGIKIIDSKNHESDDVRIIQINGVEEEIGTSKINNAELDFIEKLIDDELINKSIEKSISSIGIISGYRPQINRINSRFKNKFKNIEFGVGTVDSFQGREYDLVLLSLVRTKDLGFLNDIRRLNVALSRAKKKLIVIGNFDALNNIVVRYQDSQDLEKKYIYDELFNKFYSLKKSFESFTDAKKDIVNFLGND